MKCSIIRNATETSIQVQSIDEMRTAAVALRAKGSYEIIGYNESGRMVYWSNYVPQTRSQDEVWRM